MSGLIEHVERYLGTIQDGCSVDPDGVRMPFQIVRCRGGRVQGSTAFVTMGLSHWELGCADCANGIRHELLFMVHDDCAGLPIPSLLLQIGQEAIRSGAPLCRGDVIGPRGPLFGGPLEALYITAPTYHPDEFACWKESDGTDRIIAWLVPISKAEAEFARSWGWRAFEAVLVETQPDLLELARSSIV